MPCCPCTNTPCLARCAASALVADGSRSKYGWTIDRKRRAKVARVAKHCPRRQRPNEYDREREELRTDDTVVRVGDNPWHGDLDTAEQDIEARREHHYYTPRCERKNQTDADKHVRGVARSPLRRRIVPTLFVMFTGALEVSLPCARCQLELAPCSPSPSATTREV